MPFTSDDHLVLRFSSQQPTRSTRDRHLRKPKKACSVTTSLLYDHHAPRRGRWCRLRTASIRSSAAPHGQVEIANASPRAIQQSGRPDCRFVGGEARCGYPPGYKTGRAAHSRYAPGVPVPPGDGNLVAGPSREDIVTSRERTYRDQATILDFARSHWQKHK